MTHVLLYPLLPELRKSVAFWRVSRLLLFVLVVRACGKSEEDKYGALEG
jgi:hypothetical protein